jgi:hypothetical protein
MSTITRDAIALDAEVVQLRSQAASLHAARAKATQANDRDWGIRRDDAVRDADAARHAATRAGAQAIEHQEAANGYQATARALEVTANEAANAGDHGRAAELREDALREHALAVSANERATRAQQAAGEQSARADKLEQDVREFDKRITAEGDERTPAIERVADQLDEKAELLAQSADHQRAAARFQSEGNAEAATRATQSANDTLSRADAIQPSFADVPPVVLTEAGITAWLPPASDEVPGPDPIGPDAIGTGDEIASDDIVGTGDALDPTLDDIDAATAVDETTTDPDEPGALDGEGTAESGSFAASSADTDEPVIPAFDDSTGSTSGFGDDGAEDFARFDDPVDVAAGSDASFDFDT